MEGKSKVGGQEREGRLGRMGSGKCIQCNALSDEPKILVAGLRHNSLGEIKLS